jgi:hypothetical protein
MLLSVICGCTTIVRSEADLLFLHHPELKSKYVRLDPTTTALLKEQAMAEAIVRKHCINALEERLTNAVSIAEIQQMKRIAETIYEGDMQPIMEMQEAISVHGGQLYVYAYRDGQYGEDGLVLISGGEIRKKARVLSGKQYE